MQRALGRLSSLRNQAQRLIDEEDEAEQHLINVTAAQNDPNVRIFANADVLDADRVFNIALVDAFRATRSFEYYTAQSYAPKQDLFLVRMAGHGENNLEDYLLDLQRAFNDFEQQFGSPSERVEMLSLRDDILQIPYVDPSGRALLPNERVDLLRQKLTDPSLLDSHGYVRIGFSTDLGMTSPLTAIHKLTRIEVEMQGSDLGDRVGRVYLTSKGTATIRGLDDSLNFSRADPLTAVVNPFFNGVRLFNDSFYDEQRLKDRPFVNTQWELGLNFLDEDVNADININSISDIRVFFFYEDFTRL